VRELAAVARRLRRLAICAATVCAWRLYVLDEPERLLKLGLAALECGELVGEKEGVVGAGWRD
jgi:hypothetical protein